MRTLEEIKNNRRIEIIREGKDGFGGKFYDKESRVKLNFIMSWGAGFEHCSVSLPIRTPSWEQMCAIKDAFWTEDECCMQLHPAKKDYINNHKYCLHIWRPIKEEIPMPPSLMVGIKKEYTEEEIELLKKLIEDGDFPSWE